MADEWAASHRLAAAFFFGKWRVGGSSSNRLSPTIAYQLALNIPELRTSIGHAVEVDPAICDKALEEQARVLIVEPMKQADPVALDSEPSVTLNSEPSVALNSEPSVALDSEPSVALNSEPYLVVIDGLDECEGKTVQARIVKIIFQMVAAHNQAIAIRFLVCSRPEPNIRETFDSLPWEDSFRRLVLDQTFQPSLDILRYLRDSFLEIKRKRSPNQFELYPSWPAEGDLDSLVYSASGQFIYAATVIKFIDDEYCHPAEQLRLVLRLSTTRKGTMALAELDALYSLILCANPNTCLLVRISGTYFAIRDPRNNNQGCVSFLDDMLSLPRGSVRAALRGLHSLLVIPDSDDAYIQVYHASLQDFLLNPDRAGDFFLDMHLHHAELLKRCLYIIQDSINLPDQYSPVV
jgi:hypothetical protein